MYDRCSDPGRGTWRTSRGLTVALASACQLAVSIAHRELAFETDCFLHRGLPRDCGHAVCRNSDCAGKSDDEAGSSKMSEGDLKTMGTALKSFKKS